MRLRLLAAAAAMLASSLAAHADTLYTFTGANVLTGTSFVIDSPAFLTYSTTPVNTVSGELIYSGTDEGATTNVVFFSNTNLKINSASGFSISFGIIPSYDLSQLGTYTGTLGTLVVSNVAPAATPEPSSLALLGTGVLGVLGAARRRFA